ncbi:MAG: glycosyltransferase [Candidatus Manganitrophus sp. SB1]|nr:glycosyltransferase [Candidatus Manganitrophus morganii]
MSDLLVLLIAPKYPYPPSDGHMIRNYNLFKSFRSGYQFDFLTFGDPQLLQDREKALKQLGPCFVDMEIVPESTLRRVGKKISTLRNIFYPSALGLGLPYYSEEMAEAVNRKMASSKYDFIFFCGFSMFLYYDQKESNRIPYVVDIIDSLSLFMDSCLKVKKGMREKLTDYVNYIWAKRYEKIHFSTARNSIFITQADKDYVMKETPRSKLWVVPNGVDTDFFKSKGEPPKNDSLLFTGVMDYPPNVEAVIYFISKVLPLVREKMPNVSLTIAGRNPTTELQTLASQMPGVKLTGFVEDIRPFFEEAAVCIAPIVSGSGLKNKVLEAWSMSKPVVATSFSCNGINAVHGQNILIADAPDLFADAVITLLSDPVQRKRFAEAGRKTVEDSYSWGSQATLVDKIIKEVMGPKK